MIFKNLKFRNKIILLPAVATLAFLLILVITQQFNRENDTLLTLIETGYAPASEVTSKLEADLANIQRSLQYAASAEDEDELKNVESIRESFLAKLEQGKKNVTLAGKDLDFIEQEFVSYFPLALQTTRKMIGGSMDDGVIASMKTMQNKYNTIKDKLTTLAGDSQKKMDLAVSNARQNQKTSISTTIAIIGLAILLLAGFSLILIRSITRPLGEIVQVANELARGNNDVESEIDSKDEIGELAQVFSTLIGTNQGLAEAARAIGKGDYSVPITLRSEQDTLGNALSVMKTNLINSSREIEEKNWLKTGQAELNDKMRGELDLSALSQNVIQYLCKYLKAQIGAIYLMDEEQNLRLVGSYAYQKRKNLSNVYKLGEGIIGQAALEKQPIVLANVPDDYIKINSGLGETSPQNIVVMPFMYEGEIKGVIELGSYSGFDEIQTRFFDDVLENIGITFNSSESRTKMKELLEKSQQQAEELQSQQEELRQINEELEGQTKSLKESEARLQQQQEELQQTNEELEEKTHELEKQSEDIRHKNNQLQEASAELEQKAQDLELTSKYKSEFLANMSHELRTPLNSLLILSKLLGENKNGNLTKKQVEFADTIHSSGADLLDLINEILDLSKVESGKIDLNIEQVEFKDFSEDLKRKFKHLAKDKGLAFDIKIAKGLPGTIESDKQRVEQIVKNFLSNAFKFTSKGSVTLEIDRPVTGVDLSGSGLDPSESVAIAVTDTGKGIPVDKHKLIFEAFQQEDGSTRRKYGGTGLGLSISRELAKLLGGEIHLQSEVGEGSTFTLFLPLKLSSRDKMKLSERVAVAPKTSVHQPVAEAPIPVAKVEEKRKPKKQALADDRKKIGKKDRSILIIEDDLRFARILLEHSHKKGFKCIVATDGEDGLEFAAEYKPHAIILDVNLPGIDGWTVMEKLKDNAVTRHIPVHFITATKKTMEAMRMGAIGFLSKPVSIKNLNGAFVKIEETISKDIKNLLVVEDDEDQRKSILELIGNGDVHTKAVARGEDAYQLLKKKNFDCVILDLGLEDISGFDLLEKIRKDKAISHIPIITYTGKELSREENLILKKYSESIIIKGARSPERLLEETSLFLHRIEKNLPEDKQKMLRIIHDKEEIFENKNVLVVDDDIRNVYAITNILEEKKMNVSIAQNGREALDSLKNNGRVDLVLMDIMMPEMDGYETMREIRKQVKFNNLPIIAITAKAMKGDKNKCIEAGANDYLSKPIDTEKLFSLMRVWLYK